MKRQPGIIETYDVALQYVRDKHNTVLWRQEIDEGTIQLVRDRKLGLGALGYHVWRLCHPNYKKIWQKGELKELGVDKKTLTGWKAELRKVNLMSMHKLGDQTITIDRKGPLTTELIVAVEKIEIQALFEMKEIYRTTFKMTGRYDFIINLVADMGPPWYRPVGHHNIMRWVFRWGCQKAESAADIRAMGLLMTLWAEAPGSQRSLIELTDLLQISAPTIRGYRKFLESLGFIEFEKQKLIKVRRFQVDALSHLPDYCR
jgi:hypothetical protein